MAAEGYIRGHVEAEWRAVLAHRRGAQPGSLEAGEMESLYGPLCAIAPGQSFAVAHLAQSLDGKIAALNGASRWISGEEDLCHTHRMRALADAVVVGAETVLHDDPLLTVRRCSGTHPVRVVIDPERKLKAHHKVFTDRTARTIVIAAADRGKGVDAPDVETIALPREGRVIAPLAIKAALAEHGLHWLFIEGGGVTISNFLRDGCLDRLQITVAPVILGSGRPSITLPPISEPGLGLRPQIRRLSLGADTLFECVSAFDDMSDAARAFWLAAPGRGEICTAALPAPGPDDVVIRATASAISRGTESLVFSGRVPPSEYQSMRCPFQEGDFPAPVKYGYASVGVVEAGPAALIGQRVFCLYPHQDRYIVPASAVVPVPAAVPDERAALAANMETAVNAMWDAGPRLGDRIAVIGAGVVGCFIASLAAKLPGTRVELIDIDQRRAGIAEAFGCRFALPDEAIGECDVVFHSSASEAGLATALRLAGFEAKLIELSWYGNKQVAVPLGAAFHQRRLQLISSQVGAVASARRARRTYRDRLSLALALLADPIYDQLISGHCTLDTLPQRMAQLAAAPDGALAEIVLYR